jgi:hypothetical protein
MDASHVAPAQKRYTVEYRDFHTNKLVKIQRCPPAKIHDILPTDMVKLSVPRNEDWQAGQSFTVRALTLRNPNVLQLEKSNGETTFVNSQDVELVSKPGTPSTTQGGGEASIPSRYLLWP